MGQQGIAQPCNVCKQKKVKWEVNLIKETTHCSKCNCQISNVSRFICENCYSRSCQKCSEFGIEGKKCGCGQAWEKPEFQHETNFHCLKCTQRITNKNAYSCLKCKTFLCELCFGSKQNIENMPPKQPYCLNCKAKNKHNLMAWQKGKPTSFQCSKCKKQYSWVIPFHCSECKDQLCYSCSSWNNSGVCGCNGKFQITTGSYTCDQCGKYFPNAGRWNCVPCNCTICFSCLSKEEQKKQIEPQEVQYKPLWEEYKEFPIEINKNDFECPYCEKQNGSKERSVFWQNNSCQFKCIICEKTLNKCLPFKCRKCANFICYGCSPMKNTGKCGCLSKFQITVGGFTCDQCSIHQNNTERWHCLICNSTICLQCLPKNYEEINKKSNENSIIDKSRVVHCKFADEYFLQNMICIICDNVIIEPKKCVYCNQHYCKRCILQKLSNGQADCWNANCKRKLNINMLVEAKKELHEDLASLRVLCKYSEFGCTEQLLYYDIAAHEKNCKFQNKNKL